VETAEQKEPVEHDGSKHRAKGIIEEMKMQDIMVQLQANRDGGKDRREVNLADRNMNFDNLFNIEVGKSKFYT